jgi:hypothetical protein
MTDRDNKGRFVKGQSGNPAGRPKREVEEAYLQATIARVSMDDWQSVVKKAVEQAKDGNSEARRWLAEYIMGKPRSPVDVDVEGNISVTVTRVAARTDESSEDS